MLEKFSEKLDELRKERLEELKERKKFLEGLKPKFETEEEALAYARRLAYMKAGDTAKIPGEDRLVDVVFTGRVDKDAAPVFLVWEAGTLSNYSVAWGQVVLD